MQSATQPGRVSNAKLWAGRIISALPVLLFLFSAFLTLMNKPQVTEGMAHYGYPTRAVLPIGIAELVCTLLYIIPQTSVLGAILLTAYLGGATATHVRVGEPFYMPVLVGVLVWLGLYLREKRLQALVPLRKSN